MSTAPQTLASVQAILQERQLDALIVSQPDNRRYLSSYTVPDHGIQESSGYLLIPQEGQPWLLTDSRFTLQAEAEAKGFRLHVYRRGLLEALEALLPQLTVQSLGFEADYFLYSTHARLMELAEKLTLQLVATTNLVEDLRVVKTAEELELIGLEQLRHLRPPFHRSPLPGRGRAGAQPPTACRRARARPCGRHRCARARRR